MASKTYKTEIVREGLCYIPFPFDRSLCSAKCARRDVTINDYTYRSTIAAMEASAASRARQPRSRRPRRAAERAVTLTLDDRAKSNRPPTCSARAAPPHGTAGRSDYTTANTPRLWKRRRNRTRAKRIADTVRAIGAGGAEEVTRSDRGARRRRRR
jgi:hypothetical protein